MSVTVQAFGWGLLSSCSVLLGCAVGLVRLPGPTTRAVLMSFGGGALIQAVTIELFGELLHEQAKAPGDPSDNNGVKITFYGIGMGIVGGLMFASLNKVLNEGGGFLRRLNTAQGAMSLLKRVQRRKAVRLLKRVPAFAPLSEPVLRKLADKMEKEPWRSGQPLLRRGAAQAGLYFVASGAALVELPADDTTDAAAPPTDDDGGGGKTSAPSHVTARSPSPVALSSASRVQIADVAADPPDAVPAARTVKYVVPKDGIFGDAVLLGLGAPLPLTASVLTTGKALHLPHEDIAHALGIAPRPALADPAAEAEAWAAEVAGAAGRGPQCHLLGPFGVAGAFLARLVSSAPRDEPPAASAGGTESGTGPGLRRPSAVDLLEAAEADELEGGAGKGEAFAALGWRTAEAWGAAAGGSQDGGSNLGSRAASGLFSLPSKLGLSRSNSRTNLADGGQPGGSSASLHKRPTSFFLSRANTFLSFKPKQRDAVAVASVIAEGGTAASLTDELRAEVDHAAHGMTAALVIWCGMLADGIPESLVIGMLANLTPEAYPSLVGFVAAVALANLPEAMSASGTLKACGMPTWKIWAMWLTMFCGTGAGAIVGSAAFAPPTNEAEELAAAYGFATIVGLCGGATIAMVSNTLLPEACELGGDVVGLH